MYKAVMNGIIPVDKPAGKTSHDIVNQIRRLTGIRRVGHTGTLDPMATGVLPVCVGTAAKAADMLTSTDKRYTAELILGMTTDTQDCDGDVLTECAVTVSAEQIRSAVMSFVGEYDQLPPMYSAIKQNGKKLYELAREGITAERERRRVSIYSIQIKEIDLEKPSVVIDVFCSKGTYIRALCEDIGAKLGCGAYMNSLRRTLSGGFTIDECMNMAQLEAMAQSGTLEDALISTDAVFDYEKLYLSEKQTARVKDGVRVSHSCAAEGRTYRVYAHDGEFLCISQCMDGRLKILKTFW